jgi:hypothetical protein
VTVNLGDCLKTVVSQTKESTETLRYTDGIIYFADSSVSPPFPPVPPVNRKRNHLITTFTLRYRTTPTPAGWIEFVHPEGLKYYHNPTRRILTDSNIKSERVLQVVHRAVTILDIRLNARGLVLPDTTELTLEVDLGPRCGDNDSYGGESEKEGRREHPIVKYYFIDHAQKTEFWLESTTTATLGCPPVTSYTHLSTF